MLPNDTEATAFNGHDTAQPTTQGYGSDTWACLSSALPLLTLNSHNLRCSGLLAVSSISLSQPPLHRCHETHIYTWALCSPPPSHGPDPKSLTLFSTHVCTIAITLCVCIWRNALKKTPSLLCCTITPALAVQHHSHQILSPASSLHTLA